MKKILLIAVCIAILPSVTLASWWNPLSWFSNWSFSTTKSDSKTQILENRINELEKKLANTATSTVSKPKYDLDPPTTNTPSTYQELVNAKQEKAASIKASLAPTPTRPSTTVQSEQTNEYRKHLVPKMADGVATDEYIKSMSDYILKTMNDRIVVINSIIANNESFIIKASSWPELRDYVSDENEMLRAQNKYCEEVISTVNSIKEYAHKMGRLMADDFVRITKLSSYSQSEFERDSANFDIINKNLNEARAYQEKLGSDTMDLLDKWNVERKKRSAEEQKALDYMSASMNSRPSQYYFTPVTPIYIPIINTPRFTECNVNAYYGGDGGTIRCTSY